MPWTFAHPAIVFPLKQSRYGQCIAGFAVLFRDVPRRG
ncbi:DUF4184 family protein [Morganella morganii]|nr:DUF4184 family protein [Morganella morganii]